MSAGEDGSTGTVGAPAPRMGRAIAVYTALRFLAFVSSTAVLAVAGVPVPFAVFGGLVISSVTAWFGLRRQRQAVADALEARHERRKAEQARLRAMLDNG